MNSDLFSLSQRPFHNSEHSLTPFPFTKIQTTLGLTVTHIPKRPKLKTKWLLYWNLVLSAALLLARSYELRRKMILRGSLLITEALTN